MVIDILFDGFPDGQFTGGALFDDPQLNFTGTGKSEEIGFEFGVCGEGFVFAFTIFIFYDVQQIAPFAGGLFFSI